jgi:hypothetical protein
MSIVDSLYAEGCITFRLILLPVLGKDRTDRYRVIASFISANNLFSYLKNGYHLSFMQLLARHYSTKKKLEY